MSAVDDRRVLAVAGTGAAGSAGAGADSPSSSTGHGRVAQMRVGRVSGHKGLGLRRHGREDALLIEALTVGAPAVGGALEAGASYLFVAPQTVSARERDEPR